MCKDDVERLTGEQPAQVQCARHNCARPDRRVGCKRREVGVASTVERQPERHHTVVVTHRVESACQLESEHLGAASVTLSDNLENSHRA